MVERFPYEDIINLPPHISKKHPQPTMMERASRFSPFAAVTGYEDMVQEEARYTIEKAELDESAKERISEKLGIIAQYLGEKPQVTITYFKPDHSKAGGEYVEVTGIVKHIDEYRRVVIMENGDIIYIEDIYDIKGKIFEYPIYIDMPATPESKDSWKSSEASARVLTMWDENNMYMLYDGVIKYKNVGKLKIY